MEKIDFKILTVIAILLVAWGWFAVYQFASQYRKPLPYKPSEHVQSYDEWVKEQNFDTEGK